MYGLDESGLRVTGTGLFYGPVTLVGKSATGAFEPRDRALLRKRLAGIDIPPAGGLQAIANALNRGETSRAQIAALHLKLPPFEPKMLRRLAKANFDPNQPRDDQGMWTGEEENAETTRARYTNAIAPAYEDIPAKKQRFVDAHLADAQKAADKLHVPVENILGLSALESGWGEHPFASKGNNYFGIHYPAPFATGYVSAKENGDKVATFASYDDSLKSFTEETGSILRGKSDPSDFAKALQDSGKFGINPVDGSKVPYYVSSTASTIRHLRSFIANKNL